MSGTPQFSYSDTVACGMGRAIDLAWAAQAAAVRHRSATPLTISRSWKPTATRPATTPAPAALPTRAEQTFDHAAREDDPAWLAYFDEAYLAARMAQCFRDLGEAAKAGR